MTTLAAATGTRLGHALRKLVWGTAALLLLLPAVAMQFTTEVEWTARDFVAFGAMLLAACVTFELAWRAAHFRLAYLAAACLGIGTSFLIVWCSLAVGIVRDGGHPAEYLFHAAVLAGLLGAALTRGRPAGMALAMYSASALCAIGAVCGLALDGPVVFAITLVFMLAFLASAELFRRSA